MKTFKITCKLTHQIMATGLTAKEVFSWAEENNRDDDWSIEMRDGKFFCAYGDTEPRECSIDDLVGHDFSVEEAQLTQGGGK